ncbi:MAG: hypothetical protein IPM94_13705 [bacterium]|nr:hypothetical protein [bacterium]
MTATDNGGRDDGLAQQPRRPARVIVTPLAASHLHPLGKRDVQRVLAVLPDDSVAGLRSVSLLDTQSDERGRLVLGSFRRPGFVRLHAVPAGPWRTPALGADDVAELRRFGARVEHRGNGHLVTWTPAALRLFTVVGVLLPGVARHHRERLGHAEPGTAVRVLGDASPWVVSDLALSQWSAFLAVGRDGGAAMRAES